MTIEEAKESILEHIKEKGSIQGYVYNSKHKEVLAFLEHEMPEIDLPLERIYRKNKIQKVRRNRTFLLS